MHFFGVVSHVRHKERSWESIFATVPHKAIAKGSTGSENHTLCFLGALPHAHTWTQTWYFPSTLASWTSVVQHYSSQLDHCGPAFGVTGGGTREPGGP